MEAYKSMGLSKAKILVVDDDPFVRSMLKEILESTEYEVYTANHGKSALDLYYEILDFDLIISDMNMPEMNGLELIKSLRRQNSDVPLIILTVNNDICIAIDAIRSGADDYILKDENIADTLTVSVDKVLEKYRLKKENIRLMKELMRKNRELERLSFVDGLTGVANRRHFDTIVVREWQKGVRDKSFLSLIMIDIDYFKNFNDTYGHLTGDDCLKHVATALDDALKTSDDLLFRFGGEEFVALLPNTPLEDAVSVAEQMKNNIKVINIPHASSKAKGYVTVSIGVAGAVPEQHSDYTELIEMVDKALYVAKREGRDRIKTLQLI